MRVPLALALLLSSCSVRHPPAPASALKYVVGSGYQNGGVWYYPREDFRYDATGLAERIADRTGLTADGEAFDADAMAGAHQTLQLPAIALVTNLQNGRQALIRLNDRGPANPGRIVGLTRKAADLLGVSGPTQVRVQVEDGPSQALRDQLQGSPAGVTAAPRGAVSAEALAPPPGIGQSGRFRVAGGQAVTASVDSPVEIVPSSLPQTVTAVPPQPGQLWIRAGQFGRAIYANQVKAKLYGLPVTVSIVPGTRPPQYRVEAGPFAAAASADAALDQAREAGVTDAQIVVE